MEEMTIVITSEDHATLATLGGALLLEASETEGVESATGEIRYGWPQNAQVEVLVADEPAPPGP